MKNIILVVILGLMCLFTVRYCQWRNVQMEQYAVEHNCKWDYNDMCYTREQKPWLFNND